MFAIRRGLQVHDGECRRMTRMPPRDVPRYIEPGAPTAHPTNVAYRMGKISAVEPLAGRWLDCGCAGGGYTLALAQKGATRVIGVEAETDRLWSAVRTPEITFSSASGRALAVSQQLV